jgi:uncharacterized SAM-dependent methyltransferase
VSAVFDDAHVARPAPAGRPARASRHDLGFARDVVAGLALARKSIPGPWLSLDGPTAARALILERCADQIAALAAGRRVVFLSEPTWLGVAPLDACELLRRIGERAGAGALLVVGIDLWHDAATVVRSHGDEAAVAADIGVLARINRELGGDFDLEAFGHQARFDPERQCVETHLVSRREQRVRVLGRNFGLAAGESIRVRSVYGYSLQRFETLARCAGWERCQCWIDGRARHALHMLGRAR